MAHRRFLPTFLGCLASLTFAALTSAAPDPPSKPNIVLCMAEDQGYGDIGYLSDGAVRTPNLDRMAAEGLRLDRFYAAAPVCSPTRGSVMTGRHPNRFGCFKWGYTLKPQEITVAEVLRTIGYETGHFGKWHLGSTRGVGPNNPDSAGFGTWLSAPPFYDNNPLLSREGRVARFEGESSMIAVDAALDFIRAASERDRPFLAVIWFGSPHNPHRATEQDRAPYSDLPEPVQHYFGEITGIDRAMGRLRAELRTLGVADNTLVWYTSDNGPRGPGPNRPISRGGLRGLKGSLWEGGIRVPTIIEWPAVIDEPRVSTVPSGTVDIFPTVLELANVQSPDPDRPLDGRSLAPLIEGRMEDRPEPLGFWDHPAPGRSTPSERILGELLEAQRAGAPEPKQPTPPSEPAEQLIAAFEAGEPLPGHAAWIEGRYKLHRRPTSGGGDFTYELYDLVADPTESTNLAEREPGRLDRLKTALADWQASVVRSLRGDDD